MECLHDMMVLQVSESSGITRAMMKRIATGSGQRLAHYLNQPIRHYQSFDSSDPTMVTAVLRPADVLLVDGNSRVSTAIKYLMQSTWSHAAGQELIEADLGEGVIVVSLHKYARHNILTWADETG